MTSLLQKYDLPCMRRQRVEKKGEEEGTKAGIRKGKGEAKKQAGRTEPVWGLG